jgi:tetratricopeptide (TPR) repeat protein
MRWRARVADKGVAGRLLESLYRALSRRLEALANDLESERGATAMLAILAEDANLLATFEVRAFELSSEALESIGRMFDCDARASKIHTNELAGKFREISAEMAALQSKMQVDLLRQEANGLELRGHEQADNDDLVGACEAYEAALPIYRTIGDWRNEADTLDSLGEVKIGMDDLAGACEAYEAALLVYRKNADLLGEADTLKLLGDLKLRTEDLAGACEAYGAALPIYRQINHRLGEANALTSIGQLCAARGELAAGFRIVAQALHIQQQIDDHPGCGASHAYLARIAGEAGELLQVIGLSARAIQIFEGIDDRVSQCEALTYLGQALPDWPQALGCLLRAEALARAIGHPMAEEIASFVSGFRRDGVAVEEFAALVSKLGAHAEVVVAALFAQAEEAVAAGELDLYAPPPAQGAHDAG